MTAQKRDYWNKCGENLNCPLCDMKEDTSEHVLSCSKMPPHQLTQDDLYNIEDIGLWRKIIELYNCNDRLCSAVTNEKQAQEHEQNPDMREN